MKIDLTRLQQTQNAAAGGVRARWSGAKSIDLDLDAYLGRMAHIKAVAMGQNLHRGIRPDGSGPMPGRKKDGRPRGFGTHVGFGLYGYRTGERSWLITAAREAPGHLARILQEVPLLPPLLERLSQAVHTAFGKSLKVTR